MIRCVAQNNTEMLYNYKNKQKKTGREIDKKTTKNKT